MSPPIAPGRVQMPTPSDIINALERAPEIVVPLVREVPPAVMKRRPATGKWSAHEHACHLAVVHRLFFDRLDQMLATPSPVITPYDPGQNDPDHRLLVMDLEKSLKQFVEDRNTSIIKGRVVDADGRYEADELPADLLHADRQQDWIHDDRVRTAPRFIPGHEGQSRLLAKSSSGSTSRCRTPARSPVACQMKTAIRCRARPCRCCGFSSRTDDGHWLTPVRAAGRTISDAFVSLACNPVAMRWWRPRRRPAPSG